MPVRNKPIHLAVLISGGGRTLLNIHRHITEGRLNARIQTVISSRGDVPGVSRARDAGLPVVVIERRFLDDLTFQKKLTDAIGHVDLACMAGFLSLWKIPEHMSGRVLNIHPALLPDFGGKGMFGENVHRAVLAAGKKSSGCTVHYCDNEYDHGPILLQREVPVDEMDTPASLAARVFEAECIAYPQAIALIAAGRVAVQSGRVHILPPDTQTPNAGRTRHL